MKKIVIDKKVLEDAYEKLGNKKAVANELGVSTKVINRLFKEYGIAYALYPKTLIPKDALRTLYLKNTQAEVADILGVSLTKVKSDMKFWNIATDKSAGKGKTLTVDERSVVIGSLLGDGYINERSLNICHGKKQFGYLSYKLGLISCICKGGIFPRRKNGKIVSYRFRTEYIAEIGELRKLWYANRVKKVPMDIEKALTPLAVAIWYMDDGGRRGKATGRIATCSFNEEDVNRLSDALNNKYSLTTRVMRETKYFTIYIPHSCFKDFCQIIEEYVPECMRYKLPQV